MNYNDLSQTYSDFAVPAIKIEVDQKQLVFSNESADNTGDLIEAEISLSKGEVSTAMFNIGNTYEEENSSFIHIADVGSIIKVSIGYSSELKDIFKGYIKKILYEYDDKLNVMNISIIAMDALSLMYNEKGAKYFTKKSKTKICKDILEKYSDILTSSEVNISSEEEEVVVREEQNDIDFIRQLCIAEEKTFYIVNGNAKTEQSEPSGNSDIDLAINKGIIGFSFSETYDNTEFEYRAFNSEDPSNELISTVVSTNSEQKNIGNKPQTVRRFIRENVSSERLQKIVNENARKHKFNLQRADITCVGIPDILPGIKMKITGITSKNDERSYNVESVVHSFSDEGYVCNVSLAGWSK